MLERFVCFVAGHRYSIERILNARTRKLACSRCGGRFAMHDPTRSLVPWDDDLEALYAPGGVLSNVGELLDRA